MIESPYFNSEYPPSPKRPMITIAAAILDCFLIKLYTIEVPYPAPASNVGNTKKRYRSSAALKINTKNTKETIKSETKIKWLCSFFTFLIESYPNTSSKSTKKVKKLQSHFILVSLFIVS